MLGIIHPSYLRTCDSKVDPKVNCGLWVKMSSRCRVPSCDDHSALRQDVRNRGPAEGEGARGPPWERLCKDSTG